VNGAIEWFAKNPVAANLFMVLILAGGLMSTVTTKREVFPEMDMDLITVEVSYLGAAPEEVEEGVSVRVEEAIQGIDGVKRITSTSMEGRGQVVVELDTGADSSRVVDEVKSRVDAIDTFPAETEKPIIREITNQRQVINVAISGPADEATLKRLGEHVRDEIASLEGITLVTLQNARPYEISIEVSEETLRRHGLSFDQVARAVRMSSLDLPGGSVKTAGGEILLRTKGQAYVGREYEELVLLTRRDGTHIKLGDIAEVVDGFAETDQKARFDGQPSVFVEVYRTADQSALELADSVRAYVAEAQARMPEGISLTIWQDQSKTLRDRLSLMLRNGAGGLVLVFISLALFLRFRLAFWVSMGIPISFLGAMWVIPNFDVSINLMSLFAFIVVLGIVVDDAIVVGENIYTHQQQNGQGLQGAIEGAQEVAVPVTFGVLTTVAAFAPMLAVDGVMGKFMRVLPLIVIPCLLFSFLESKFILPSHLSHIGKKELLGQRGRWQRFQEFFSKGLIWFVHSVYEPVLEHALRLRYLTVSTALALLIVTLGMVGAGWVSFDFMPSVEADYIASTVTMPQGTPVEVTSAAVERLENAARELSRQLEERGGQPMFRHISASIGDQPYTNAQSAMFGFGATASGSHLGEVTIELTPAELRGGIGSEEMARQWEALAGAIPDAVELKFTASIFSTGEDVNVELTGASLDELRSVADAIKAKLREYPGVSQITDTFRTGKREIKLDIKPEAELLGLTLNDLARQVRQAFYGDEAQRIQRGRDDIRVMVRYPYDERTSLGNLENMRVRTPAGGEVPFSQVAILDEGRGFSSIRRVDRKRAVSVTADVDVSIVATGDVIADLDSRLLPDILADFPGVYHSFEGQAAEQRDSIEGLQRGFVVALLVIFTLLAIPLKSYIQPLIIMTAIPFGVVGAVWGHVFMGLNLTILSMFGLVALTGVVVNDSLVLVDFINRKRRAEVSLAAAVREAGRARFRPILLTSLTTFLGLTPLLMETSLQAQFLIPMAVSLAFGVVFATFISLLIVPAVYLIIDDATHIIATLRGEREPVEHEAFDQTMVS
jgi:multidrug efflux pump subunit AcrB